uniref:RNase III domain-containing protein n=1 Tax=Odontella aurita TaxID=265563 RepID=A0A7S4MYU6_9STRA
MAASSTTTTTPRVWAEKRELMGRDASTAGYESIQPPWAIAPIVCPPSAAAASTATAAKAEAGPTSSSKELYLYELIFTDAGSGEPFVPRRMGVVAAEDHDGIIEDDACTTPLGVVFGSDMTDDDGMPLGELSATFSIPAAGGGNNGGSGSGSGGGGGADSSSATTKVRVRLSRRTVLEAREMEREVRRAASAFTSSSSPPSRDPVALMKAFNVLLFRRPKLYGIERPVPEFDALRGYAEAADGGAAGGRGGGRTCLFVPLLCRPQRHSPKGKQQTVGASASMIDWEVVSAACHHRETPCLCRRFDDDVPIPHVLRYASAALTLAGMLALAPAASSRPSSLCWSSHDCCCCGGAVAVALFVLSGALLAADLADRPGEALPLSRLRNRFLIEPLGRKNRLYVLRDTAGAGTRGAGPATETAEEEEKEETANSSLLSESDLDSLSEEAKVRARDMLELTGGESEEEEEEGDDLLGTLSHEEYYRRAFHVRLRHPDRALLRASLMEKPADHDFIASPNNAANVGFRAKKSEGKVNSIKIAVARSEYLVPELTRYLPMPRDVLYLCQRAPDFMAALEREWVVVRLAKRMERLEANARGAFPPLAVAVENGEREEGEERLSRGEGGRPAPPPSEHLTKNLRDATTLYPCGYENLEVLGDSVLLFFLGINLFARNGQLELNPDLLRDCISDTVKNKQLFHAALRVRLHEVVGNAGQVLRWTTRYDCSERPEETDVPSSEARSSAASVADISDGNLSDVVESLLGVAFLSGRDEEGAGLNDGCMVVGLLELFELYLAPEVIHTSSKGRPWFRGMGTCTARGYPFECDGQWTKELTSAEAVLRRESGLLAALEGKVSDLCQLLGCGTGGRPGALANEICAGTCSRMLLMCALFDDSLDEESAHPFRDIDGLQRIALMRETLFQVGNGALQLAVMDDLYRRYHERATSGDFHLMRASTLSDDVLAYIMLKNGLHMTLFDEGAESISLLSYEMETADELGNAEWNKRGGWILPGGVEEYRKRLGKDVEGSTNRFPKYTGLMPCRLWGHKKKLESEATSDLVFSFKCIAGALTLSVGLEGMWHLIRPLFGELLMISAEEYREAFKGKCLIIDNYKKGRK